MWEKAWAAVPFNESWGQHRTAATVGHIRERDPTRLVEDNSVCCGIGHTETDINSWHAYLPGWDEAVHAQVAFELEHCPQGLHLLIATRSDPALPLARLRARGQMVELRRADLGFTEAEAAELRAERAELELTQRAQADLLDLEDATRQELELIREEVAEWKEARLERLEQERREAEERRRQQEREVQEAMDQLKRMQAEADARTSQLGMLRYQLNPHFLFNTLNTVNALIRTGDNRTAQKMVARLGDFLRYSLDSDPDLMIPLEQEVEALMRYLEIEKIRFGDRLELAFGIEGDAGRAMVPSLLLQPLVENSIKHAIAANEAGGTIGLGAKIEGRDLLLEVTDTGSGHELQPVIIGNGRGVGLENTLQRLKTLYNDAYAFDIRPLRESGLQVTIRIPYEAA